MESTINFNDLPKHVLQKIPLSLRIAKDVHSFDELPNEIQYLLANYEANTPNEIDYSNVIELEPDISIYNDFQTLRTTKKAIMEYLSNHLQTLIGSYPYDVTEGSGLKFHLQTKDETLRNTLISNEINLIIDALSNNYQMDITIVNNDYQRVEYEDRTEIHLLLTIKVDDEEFSVTIS